jgi:LmbE family N-acetylglucosaminyl deacetylase
MKHAIRTFERMLLARGAQPLDEHDLAQPALVFAPHPDDETLGCGGTLLKKLSAGARVGVVFLTDGRRSHARLMAEDELRAVREREAQAACRALGIEPQQVFFFGFADGELSRFQREATARVAQLLSEWRPVEVFVPYRHEPPSDHYVTYQVVMSALAQRHMHTLVYEYPIWFWDHWPWTSVRAHSAIARGGALKRSLLASMRLLRDFRCAVDITDVLDRKRAALAEHRSQMMRLAPDPRWAILGDVSNGEFLECFFQRYELFQRRTTNDE